MKNSFKNLIFAGTFDNLHIGHKKMLEHAFRISEHVSIFITTKKLYKTKLLANLIRTWQVRKRLMQQYLRERNWLNRTSFYKLDDVFGSSVKETSFDSILVTEGTKRNAEKINEMRKRKGLTEFKIVVGPYVRGDDGEVVTSERIRRGEIDSHGHNFQSLISNLKRKQLILPEDLREELRKPLGTVIRGSNDRLSEAARIILHYINIMKYSVVVAVGDIVTKSLLDIGFIPDISIIDLRSRRKEITNEKLRLINQVRNSKNQVYKIKNKQGTIDLQAVNTIKKSYNHFLLTGKKQLIVAEGEEDLLALPAILFAPLHSIVIYGQWNLGVVMVKVTEEKKKETRTILTRFS